MKNEKKHVWKSGLLCILLLAGCSKNQSDVTPVPPNTSSSNVQATLLSGTWAITSLIQKTEDKTSVYNGYSFSFFDRGIVKASKSGVETSGSWSYTPSAVGYYGSTPSKASMIINFGTANVLTKISKTWNIDTTKTNTSSLGLINPEIIEEEHLVFSKQ